MRLPIALSIAASTSVLLGLTVHPTPAAEAAAPLASSLSAKLEWWREARFGMFIHWGPVSLKGTEIGWSRGAQIPIEEYDRLYQQFNPTNFDARAWMQVARKAGMKYVVFTTKHHDGFCMWNTRQTDFNIMRSPFGRDVLQELAAAARQEGLAFGTYHSVCDWHHPDFPRTSPGGEVRRTQFDLDRYEQYLRAQTSELVTQYGPLLLMWFDVPQEFDAARGQRLIDHLRSLQPDLIVNNRSGAPGDYDTPEQRVGGFQMTRPWETCMTICQQWAWKPNDRLKSLEECLRTLVLCAGGDGNLLLNVGPTPDGRIEARQAERLREIGAWLGKYGETIYGTRGGPWKPTRAVASTRKGNRIYLHLLGCGGGAIELPDLPVKILGSALLSGGKVSVKQSGGHLTLKLARADCQVPDTIVRLDLPVSALSLAPIAIPGPVKASSSNVYHQMAEYEPAMAFDENPDTRWATDAGTHQAWIAADFGRPRKLRGIHIQEECGSRVRQFEFQCKEGGEWKTVFRGTTIGSGFHREFPEISAREVRLNISEALEGPTLSEISFDEAAR